MARKRPKSYQELLEENAHLRSRIETLERSLDAANTARCELMIHTDVLELSVSAACTAISQRALSDRDEKGTLERIVSQHGAEVGYAYDALKKALAHKYRTTADVLFQSAPDTKHNS